MSTKPCTRFQAGGRPCPNRTNRADGWCGNCDGYGNADLTPLAPEDDVAMVGRWFTSRTNWERAKPPIDADEIQDVEVGYRAIEWYANHHGTTKPEAEAQIRSLLEDCLLNGAILRNSRGYFRIETGGHNKNTSGYGLGMTPDGNKVISYHTRHRERTYAQSKAGVKSRATAGRSEYQKEKRRLKRAEKRLLENSQEQE